MTQVEFEETRISSPVRYKNTPKMLEWVIKYSGGLIKNERQANFVLLVFVILSIILTLYVFFKSGPSTEPPTDLMIEQAGSPSEISL